VRLMTGRTAPLDVMSAALDTVLDDEPADKLTR